MLARWQFMVATVVAVLVALSVGYSMSLYGQNRATQAELNTRVQYLQQSAQLEVIYREMVKGLADLSVRNQDKALSDLLASQGITVNANPAATPATSASPVDPRKGAKP